MVAKVRVKNIGDETVYHVSCRVSGPKDYYPFVNGENSAEFMKMMKFFCRNFKCELLSFCLMGNHYHMIVKMYRPRKLSRESLEETAYLFYPKSKYYISRWHEEDWARFEKRLFDVSELMRSMNQAFAKWFNLQNNCRGSFWADRFSSTILGTPSAIQECMLYVDLNPVRAGLVDKPEDYEMSSCFLRVIGKDEFLVDLKKLFPTDSKKMSLRVYLQVLYLRGSVPQKKNKRRIPQDVYDKAVKREFRPAGVYRKQLKYFVSGLVISTKSKIKKKLMELKEDNKYMVKREVGIEQLTGDVTLRSQKNNKAP